MTDCHDILAQVSKIIYIFATLLRNNNNRHIYEKIDDSGRSRLCSNYCNGSECRLLYRKDERGQENRGKSRQGEKEW